MFLWVGGRGSEGQSDQRSIYQRIRDFEVLDRRKTVTALRAGEDRAVLLGVSMVSLSVMMYFVLGITVLRSYSDSLWTEEDMCTVMNASIVCDISCSISCGPECRSSSRYPCLQVFVSLNSTGKVVRLLHNEDSQEANPECFFVPRCHRNYASSLSAVLEVSERLRSQLLLRCFTQPSDRSGGAILTRFYSPAAVFHSLFWPTCSLVGGAVLIAMVKLTQYLSVMRERLSRIKR